MQLKGYRNDFAGYCPCIAVAGKKARIYKIGPNGEDVVFVIRFGVKNVQRPIMSERSELEGTLVPASPVEASNYLHKSFS